MKGPKFPTLHTEASRPVVEKNRKTTELEHNRRLEAIERIKAELPQKLGIADFVAKHPLHKKIGNFFERNVYYAENEEEILNALKENADIQSGMQDRSELGSICLQILQDYNNAIAESERLEQEVYKRFALNLNGDTFEDVSINRLITRIYGTCDSMWDNLPDDTTIEKFDNEWVRLYQIVSNENPTVIINWKSTISNIIRRIIDASRNDDVNQEDNYNYDTGKIFNDIDTFFDLENIDPQSIPVIIDLLFASQELEKEEYGTFGDPTDEIDLRIHEYRDTSFRDVLYTYIETQLKPRLSTVFQTIKYDAVMTTWENSNSNYSSNLGITLPKKQLDELITESMKNRFVDSAVDHGGFDLMLRLTNDYYAQYISNDTFFVVQHDNQEKSIPVTIQDLLEVNGIGHPTVSNKQIEEYRSIMDLRVRASLEEIFCFKLTELSIKEQYFFLNFLKKITQDEIDSVRQFATLHGTEGMRTFLSLERGDEILGDRLIAFGQQGELASTVFAYYGELLTSAERAEVLVRELSDCEGTVCVDLANQVRENILNRAQKDLEKAVRANDPSEVAIQIEGYVAAAKEYVALLQEVDAGHIESVPSVAIPPEDQEKMAELLRSNYERTYPKPEDNEFKLAVAASMQKSFANPDTTFHILRDHGKIVSFNRFDTIRDQKNKEVTLFGSFNTDPAYSGAGGIMLEKTVSERLKDGRPMMAHCDPTQAITRKYIEDGFVATKYFPMAGKPSFEIWRTQDVSEKFVSKTLTPEELVAMRNLPRTISVREQDTDSESYQELLWNNVLTRSFTHNGKSYLVFEKIPEDLKELFRRKES